MKPYALHTSPQVKEKVCQISQLHERQFYKELVPLYSECRKGNSPTTFE